MLSRGVLFLAWMVFGFSEASVIHTVQKGESLFAIGKKHGVTVEMIMKENGISDARKVKVGQKLRIPVVSESKVPEVSKVERVLVVPERYVVQRGESYEEICRKYGLKEAEVRQRNHDVDLEAGVVLILRVNAKTVWKSKERDRTEEREDRDSKYLFIGSVKHLIDLPRIQKERWKYIVVHHSATSSGNAAIFDLAHRQRGMENGLAYHFVIGNGKDAKDGEIEVGNRWLKQLQGGHLRSEELNRIAIGICLVGNFEETRPTRRQQAAAIELINYLRQRSGKPYPEFKAHREINPMPTSCPGRNFPISAFHRIFDHEE